MGRLNAFKLLRGSIRPWLMVVMLFTMAPMASAAEDERAASEIAMAFVRAAVSDQPKMRGLAAVDEMARALFGEDLSTCASDEVEGIRDDLAEFIEKSFAAPAMREIYEGSKVEQPQLQETTEKTLRFRVPVATPNFGRGSMNIVVQRIGTQWKVVEFGVGAANDIALLRESYQKNQRKHRPPQWIRRMVERLQREFLEPATRLATTSPVRHSTKQYQSAPEAIAAYCRMFKEGHAAEAVERFWDFDMFLRSAFGAAYESMAADDKAECQGLMLGYLKPVMASALLTDSFKHADFSIKETYELSEGRGVVVTRMEARELKNTTRFYLWCSQDGWKIYDSMSNGPSLADEFAKRYRRTGEGLGPLVILRAAKEEADEIAKRARDLDAKHLAATRRAQ